MIKAIFPVIKVRGSFATSLCCIAAALVLILSACSTSSTPTTTTTPTTNNGSPSGQQPGDFGLGALPGYQVSLFARLPSGVTGPDSLVVDNGFRVHRLSKHDSEGLHRSIHQHCRPIRHDWENAQIVHSAWT